MVIFICSSFDGKLGPKNKKILFKMKAVSYINSNMLNLIITFICSALDMKYPFCENLIQKVQNFSLRQNFCTNSNILNSMVMFKFSFLKRK